MRLYVRNLILQPSASERHVERAQIDSVALHIVTMIPEAQSLMIHPLEKAYFFKYITAFDEYFDAIKEVTDSAEAGKGAVANTILTTRVVPFRRNLAEISSRLVSANIAAAEDARTHINRLQERFLVSGVLIMLLSLGISFFIYNYVASRFSGYIARITAEEQEVGKLLELLTARQKKIEYLMINLSTVEEDQRKRFSHDLHDAIGHGLTTAKFYIDSARAELANGSFKGKEFLDKAVETILETLTEVKRISYELRPTLLDDVDFSAAVAQFITEFERRTGIRVTTDINLPPGPLHSLVEINLYRIIQESFTNIEKHAGAKRVSLQIIGRNDGTVAVSISDDGKGFEVRDVAFGADKRHLGLRNIIERGELIGGTVLIESHRNRGTEINIELPPIAQDSGHD
jgi:signal transduction histidine kinase